MKVDSKPVVVKKKNSGNERRKGKEVVETDESDSESESNPDDDSSDDDIIQIVAMIVKGFKKMKFRKQRRQENFTKKFSKTDGKERFRKKEGKDFKAGKVDKSKIKCFKCDGTGHYANECMKPKSSKGGGKALITSNRNWLDESDSEEEQNYALMAEFEDASLITEKVPQNVYIFNTDNLSDLKYFLKSLHTNFKSQSLENFRLINELTNLKKRNEFLESELICLNESQEECVKAKHLHSLLNIQSESLKDDLKRVMKV